MSVELVLKLLGGLALFLYGMQMMSTNLESAAGDRMKAILEKLTSNRLLGVAVGAAITAIIQSSSATTVMVVGFVNSGMMTLRQAVWIIMGANVGTTITGQLIALDVNTIAPLIAFCGVILIVFIKNKKTQYIGGIIAGLGILFIGMGMMSGAMTPLRDSETFINLITKFSNPLIGILVGMVFTAVIQSSSASVGILQALAISGLIGLDGAVFVLFGQNIGTCITAVLASVGTNRNAKRTTIIHLLFNIIGTAVFVIISLSTPFVQWMIDFSPENAAAQIANTHTIFNVTTTLLLLPFGTVMAKAATKLLPDKKQDHTDEEKWLDGIMKSPHHTLGISTIAIQSLKEDITGMLKIAIQNIEQGFTAIQAVDDSQLHNIERREEELDALNIKVSKKVGKVLLLEHSVKDTTVINHIFKISGNIERLGDHAMNLIEYVPVMKEKGLSLSEAANKELSKMKGICMHGLDEVVNTNNINRWQVLGEVKILEQQIDDTNKEYAQNQLNRISNGECNIEMSILYSQILTDYERIGDHILNIAESYVEVESGAM